MRGIKPHTAGQGWGKRKAAALEPRLSVFLAFLLLRRGRGGSGFVAVFAPCRKTAADMALRLVDVEDAFDLDI